AKERGGGAHKADQGSHPQGRGREYNEEVRGSRRQSRGQVGFGTRDFGIRPPNPESQTINPDWLSTVCPRVRRARAERSAFPRGFREWTAFLRTFTASASTFRKSRPR